MKQVADPYLDRQAVRSTVEEILDRFSTRQFTITESCDNWSKIMTEKREIEILWERTMSENVQVSEGCGCPSYYIAVLTSTANHPQTLNVTSKIDHDLYPVLTVASEQPADLKEFVQSRLGQVSRAIDEAKGELQERIKSTSHLEPSDDETNRKLHQVIDNLQSIKVKLETLNVNYETLIISMMSFFDSIISTQKRIENYFERDRGTKTPASHEEFRQSTMEHFRSLISQSETIIQRIRDQEPEGAKEHDTDRIITLLERLRVTFESQADSKQSELMEYNALNQFKVNIREMLATLDDLTKQLTDVQQPAVDEGYASALAKSRLYEYLEQTIEVSSAKIFGE